MKKILLLVATIYSFTNLAIAQTDRPDSSFGTNGIVKTPLGKTFNYGAPAAGQILPLPDGSIYIVHQNDGTYQRYISKRHSNGSADSSFGVRGQSADAGLVITQAAIQPDGKIVVTGSNDNFDFAVARYNINGSLDSSFSDDGKQTTDFGENYNESSWSVVIQKDKKILVAGISFGVVYNYVSLARYNTDGRLDSTFHNNGLLKTDLLTYNTIPKVAIQNDGKIVLSHYASLVRLNSDGSTDSTFVMKETQDIGAIDALALESNGKIVVLGDNDNALYRYNSNGSADKSFGNNGIVPKSNDSYPFSDIALQKDGKILATNSTFLMRFNTNGSLDKTFGNNGKQTCFKSNADAGTVAIQSDGKIVAGGVKYYTQNFYSVNLALARFNTNGKPDSTFAGDGELIYGYNAGNAIYTSTVIQKDGKIVAAGRAWNDSAFDYIITRYNTDGSIDKTFGRNGTVTTSIFSGSYDQYKISIAIQSDGKIVASGGYSPERYNTDGSLDKTFLIDKKRLTDLNHYIQLAAIQNDGKIVVTELEFSDVDDDFKSWLVRYNTNGTPDKTYGVDGRQKVDYAPSSIAAQNDGKIIAAGGHFEFAQAVERFNTDGTLDKTFSDDGRAYFPAGRSASSISIQNDGKIIVAGTDNADFLLWRFNADGSLDQNFNNKSYYGIFKNSQFPYISTALQNNGKIVVLGGDFFRFYKNGDQDYTFNIRNKEKDDFERTNIAIANDKLYVPGGDNYGIVEKYLLDTVSNTAPAVSITTPANNTTFIAPANIKLIAAASDADGSVSKVEFYNNTTLLHTETVPRYAYELRNLPPGNYTFTAKATDNSGTVTVSVPVHISVVPDKGFTVRITRPSHNQTFAAPASIHFEAAANDPGGRITKVEFYNDSTLLSTEVEYPYAYAWKKVPAGTYSITARATNDKGVVAISAPVIVTVTANTMIVSSRYKNSKTPANKAISLTLYPNPATNVVNIYTNGLQQSKPATISIISVSGNVLKTVQTNNSTTQLDVSLLVSGVYTIKIVSGDKVVYKQFVKL